MDVKEILKHVDHTLLLQPSTWEEIKQICDDAMEYGTASVCIPPSYVKQAAEQMCIRDRAVADGANVIVLPGYMFAATIVEQSEMYPDVKFIAPDVSAGDICEKGVGEGYTYNPDDYEVTDYYNADNVYCCTYQEEIRCV